MTSKEASLRMLRSAVDRMNEKPNAADLLVARAAVHGSIRAGATDEEILRAQRRDA